MKKLHLLFSLMISLLIFASCATSKEARNYRKEINGHWQLQTIVTQGITGKIKAEIFNEVDFNCFVGSNWVFNNNSSLGSYSISKNANECAAMVRDFRWSIYEADGQPKLLQFKRLDKNFKEIDANSSGFRFTIVHIDKSSMQLRSDIVFENKQASFIYNFIKN
ncbi:MAG: lipocalin family protein [Bacteroidetes bacterium]|nr:lipocalin family protein [Bacteroidota bacterium]MBS1755859.1 lipocalin family protein [Bacteroidota bacterium]